MPPFRLDFYRVKGGEYKLLQFDSKIVGKEIGFGYLRDKIANRGFTIGGNWEYYKGSFDSILWKEAGNYLFACSLYRNIRGT